MSATTDRPAAAETCEVFHVDAAKVAAIRAALPSGDALEALAPFLDIDPAGGTFTVRPEALAETFRALGDPTRVRLLTALAQAELCVCDLAALAGISESATSHQLRLLRSLRLVRTRRDGRMVYYRLDDDHIVKLLAQGVDGVAPFADVAIATSTAESL